MWTSSCVTWHRVIVGQELETMTEQAIQSCLQSVCLLATDLQLKFNVEVEVETQDLTSAHQDLTSACQMSKWD